MIYLPTVKHHHLCFNMAPKIYKYFLINQVPAAFWFYVLNMSHRYTLSREYVATDEAFIGTYETFKRDYEGLRGRVRGFVRLFGEGRFVCDGEMPRRGDEAGGPHRCALLEQAPPPYELRYEDWDALDARFDQVSLHPPSFRSLYGEAQLAVEGAAEEVTSLVSGLSISSSTPPVTVSVQASASMRPRLTALMMDIEERKKMRRWRQR